MRIIRNEEIIDWQGTPEQFVVSSLPGKGWSVYDGPWPIPVPVPIIVIPTSVSMRQARLQLAAIGAYQTVCAAVATMGDAAQIEWEYATEVSRDNLLTTAMIVLLGWSTEQTDEYFLSASKL